MAVHVSVKNIGEVNKKGLVLTISIFQNSRAANSTTATAQSEADLVDDIEGRKGDFEPLRAAREISFVLIVLPS